MTTVRTDTLGYQIKDLKVEDTRPKKSKVPFCYYYKNLKAFSTKT